MIYCVSAFPLNCLSTFLSNLKVMQDITFHSLTYMVIYQSAAHMGGEITYVLCIIYITFYRPKHTNTMQPTKQIVLMIMFAE